MKYTCKYCKYIFNINEILKNDDIYIRCNCRQLFKYTDYYSYCLYFSFNQMFIILLFNNNKTIIKYKEKELIFDYIFSQNQIDNFQINLINYF